MKRLWYLCVVLSLMLSIPAFAGSSGELSVDMSGAFNVPARMGSNDAAFSQENHCYLKGEEVPCMNHAYDRRTGSVPMKVVEPLHDISTADCKPYTDHRGYIYSGCEKLNLGVLNVDDLDNTLVYRSGGKTPSGDWVAVRVDKDGYVIPSPCYKRMQEAIRLAYTHIEYHENGVRIFPGTIMSEQAWKTFKKTEQECAQ